MIQKFSKKILLLRMLILVSIFASSNIAATGLKGKVADPGKRTLANAHVLLLNNADRLNRFSHIDLDDINP